MYISFIGLPLFAIFNIGGLHGWITHQDDCVICYLVLLSFDYCTGGCLYGTCLSVFLTSYKARVYRERRMPLIYVQYRKLILFIYLYYKSKLFIK